jgi:hypothetical protein
MRRGVLWLPAKGLLIGTSLLLAPLSLWVLFKMAWPAEGLVPASGTLIPCVRAANGSRDHGFEPGCEGKGRTGAYSAMMRFNSLGLRGPDFPRQPAKGTVRVLLLGSSNVLGLGIAEENTLGNRLEDELRRRLKRKVEVINGATNGYHTWQSAIHLHELVDYYRPHLVLFNVMSPTCFIFDSAWASRVVFNAAGDPVRIDRSLLGEGRTPPWLNAFYFRDAATFYFLHTVHDQLRRLRAAWSAKLAGETLHRLVAATRRGVAYMQERSEKSGAVFAAFIHGSGDPLQGQAVPAQMSYPTVKFMHSFYPPLEFDRLVVNETVQSSKPLILHLKEFKFEPMENDNHLRPEMTSRWAEVLSDYLERQGVLKRLLEARP